MVWLKVPHEIAIKLLVCWDCCHPKAWPGLEDLLLSLLIRHLAGGLSSLPHGPLHRAAFPQNKWSKTEAAGPFHDLVSKVTHCHFCFIFFIRSKSLSPALGRGISLYLQKGRVSNNLWTYFKASTNFPFPTVPCDSKLAQQA